MVQSLSSLTSGSTSTGNAEQDRANWELTQAILKNSLAALKNDSSGGTIPPQVINHAASATSNLLESGGCDRLDDASSLMSSVLSTAMTGTVADERASSLSTSNIDAFGQRTNVGQQAQITLANNVTLNLPPEALRVRACLHACLVARLVLSHRCPLGPRLCLQSNLSSLDVNVLHFASQWRQCRTTGNGEQITSDITGASLFPLLHCTARSVSDHAAPWLVRCAFALQ